MSDGGLSIAAGDGHQGQFELGAPCREDRRAVGGVLHPAVGDALELLLPACLFIGPDGVEVLSRILAEALLCAFVELGDYRPRAPGERFPRIAVQRGPGGGGDPVDAVRSDQPVK